MFLSERNKSGATFTLLGFSDHPELQEPLFSTFFTIFSVTVAGNLGMILTIKINPKLHIPMYFFLSHFSFVDFYPSNNIISFLIREKNVLPKPGSDCPPATCVPLINPQVRANKEKVRHRGTNLRPFCKRTEDFPSCD